MRPLKNRAHSHSELFATIFALIDSWPRALALQRSDGLTPTMNACSTFRPPNIFKHRASLIVSDAHNRQKTFSLLCHDIPLSGLHTMIEKTPWFVKRIIFPLGK